MITFLILLSISLRTINGYDKVSSFSCNGRAPGYYADINLDCKIYYLCNQHSFKTTFSCPERTAFEQRSMNWTTKFKNSSRVKRMGYSLITPRSSIHQFLRSPSKNLRINFLSKDTQISLSTIRALSWSSKSFPDYISQYQRPSKPSHQQLRHSYCRHKSTCKHRKLYKILRKSPKDGARGGSTSKNTSDIQSS
ncbi:unnamed protein product [Lepeophtheirus salmonis]|uniref:(salmon louse) hypothetical protein n=1 Tax=Lepeophtheirus salmonis TaxID=72036 RepID=A0A7R8D5Y5_LEPSM|nr:unnamed protein product [Lepeophtheirus salmonis]CAF3039416.1 unnamed protein product [Lepeophtheirus salmonis]